MHFINIVANVANPGHSVNVDLPQGSSILRAVYDPKTRTINVFAAVFDPAHTPMCSFAEWPDEDHAVIFLQAKDAIPDGYRFVNAVHTGSIYNDTGKLWFAYTRNTTNNPRPLPTTSGVFIPDPDTVPPVEKPQTGTGWTDEKKTVKVENADTITFDVQQPDGTTKPYTAKLKDVSFVPSGAPIPVTNLSEDKKPPKTHEFIEVTGYAWKGGVPDPLTPENEKVLRHWANVDPKDTGKLSFDRETVRVLLHALDTERRLTGNVARQLADMTESRDNWRNTAQEAAKSCREHEDVAKHWRQAYDLCRGVMHEERQNIKALEDALAQSQKRAGVAEHTFQVAMDNLHRVKKARGQEERWTDPKILEAKHLLPGTRVQLKDRPDQKGEVITLGKDYAIVMFDKGLGASCGYTFDSLEPEKK